MEKVEDSPVFFHGLVVKDVYKWTKFVRKKDGGGSSGVVID